MKIRIVNDSGIGRNTEITNTETGEKVGDVRSANIRFATDGIVIAELTFNIPKIDVFAIAKLSEETKQGLRHLRDLLEKIDIMEKAKRDA